MTAGAISGAQARPAAGTLLGLSEKLAFAGVLLLAAVLRIWNLSINGFANSYYSAAVRSMGMNWHNFLYMAFDPAGVISLDKPPVAIWAQVIGTKLFGFTPFGILFPQAVLGLAAVIWAYDVVRRTVGVWAGLAAALALAVTPISVVMDRHNNPDCMLEFLLTASAWALVRAIPKARFGWFSASMLLAGLSVNTKMLQALVPLPAFFLAYLLCAGTTWKKRAIQLCLGAAIFAIVSVSWIAMFDLTPADSRPYAGSSSNGTMRDLFFGYNGLSRVNGVVPNAPGVPAFSEMGGLPGTGKPGLLRFSDRTLSSQSFWLFPFALLGSVAALTGKRGVGAVIVFGGWAALSWAVLSVSKGIIHTYYAELLVTPMAVLAGLGAFSLLEAWRDGGWRRWLLPAAVLATAGWQDYLTAPGEIWQLRVAMWILAAASLGILAFGVSVRFGAAPTALTIAMAGFLCCPAAWSFATLSQPEAPGLPQAGPPLTHAAPPPVQTSVPTDPALLRYLAAKRGPEKILAVTASALMAGPIVQETGLPIVPMGGFLGTDRAMPLDKLARLVREHNVRFVLSTQMDMMSGDAARSEWVRENCSIVPEAKWRAGAPGSAGTAASSVVVFDCQEN